MPAALSKGWLLSAAFAGATFARAPAAQAEDKVGFSFEASADGAMVPANDLHVGAGTPVGPRSVGGTLRLDSTTFYAGAGVGFGLLTRHFVIPLLSLDYYSAAGAYDEQRTSIDGSIAHIRPWSGGLYDLGLGGFGFRANERRWTFAATGRVGVTFETMGADAAYGGATYDLGPSRAAPYVRVDFEACRRLDPLERLCLVVSPNVYAFDQTFHGGMLSLRYELGK
jgi:hypothetical protein